MASTSASRPTPPRERHQKRKIIIDTDPGVDDVIALLYALAQPSDVFELLLISVTFGNTTCTKALQNVLATFHILQKELDWRKASGRPLGYQTLRTCSVLVAVGSDEPLDGGELTTAMYFHGADGLGGIRESYPELSPEQTWSVVESEAAEPPGPNRCDDEPAQLAAEVEPEPTPSAEPLYQGSPLPAHEAILHILRTNTPKSVTIIAVAPLTNIALAAMTDPQTFARAKEIVVMGGSVGYPGNAAPLAEFNIHSDPLAAAKVFSLTSELPASTFPPEAQRLVRHSSVVDPPEGASGVVSQLTLFPLDVTTQVGVRQHDLLDALRPAVEAGSPLALWFTRIMELTFDRMLKRVSPTTHPRGELFQLHDPLCVEYVRCETATALEGWSFEEDEDLRPEFMGFFSEGMLVKDRRGYPRSRKERAGAGEGDDGDWLRKEAGNRVKRVVDIPIVGGVSRKETFGMDMVRQIIGEVR